MEPSYYKDTSLRYLDAESADYLIDEFLNQNTYNTLTIVKLRELFLSYHFSVGYIECNGPVLRICDNLKVDIHHEIKKLKLIYKYSGKSIRFLPDKIKYIHLIDKLLEVAEDMIILRASNNE